MSIENSWVVSNGSTTEWWRFSCWVEELGLFVAVAENAASNNIKTSVDGMTWIARNNPTGLALYSVCWSPSLGLLVALTAGGKAITSSDAITWTEHACPSGIFLSVCWSPSLNLFVAVAFSGTSNRAMYSSDGVSWTAVSAHANQWRSVCWSSSIGKFVAIADSPSNANSVMTSVDGIAWVSVSAFSGYYFCVTSGNNRLVTVGVGADVMYSDDAVTWYKTTATRGIEWNSVLFSAELGIYLAIGNSPSGDVSMFSEDGVRWYPAGLVSSRIWRYLAWSPSLAIFSGVAGGGGNVATSYLPFAKLQLTISNQGPAANFNVLVIGAKNYDVYGRRFVVQGVVNIPVLYKKTCYATVYQYHGYEWEPNVFYVVGALVYPKNPSATPYYYRRTIQGLSGSVEPSWLTSAGSFTNDGSVNSAWELIYGLVQPVTHGPLLPVL